MKVHCRFLVCLWLFGTGAQAVAGEFGCAILSDGEPVTVRVADRTYSTPVRLKDCNGAVVSGGNATVCYSLADGRRSCHGLVDGQPIDGATLNAGSDGEKFGFLAMLLGDQQARQGISRGLAPAGGAAGMPVGRILPPDQPLVLDLSRLGLSPPLRLQLRRGDDRRAVIDVKQSAAGPWKIPARKLVAGEHYRWQVTGVAGTADGEFDVVRANDAAAVQNEIAATVGGQALTARERAMVVADILATAGYPWDAERVLAAAGIRFAAE